MLSREDTMCQVLPKIVPADQETVVELWPAHRNMRLLPDAEYRVRCFPTEEYQGDSIWPHATVVTCRAQGGRLRVPLYFGGEQEHSIAVEEVRGGETEVLGDFRVFSLREDLYGRRPYKGDLHMHSNRSDGKEEPGYVAGACRRIGLDFMALTDHKRYEPSLEAQRAFEGVSLDLRIFPGEEVHPPDNPVHMINFGGRFSVNALFDDESSYRAQTLAIEHSLGHLPPGVDRRAYASCVWCFDKIREGGGLAIFCHPYWFTQNYYNISGLLTNALLDRQPYDALELLGGYSLREVDSNTLQVARYNEERAAGKRIPIVGVSDAHGCERGHLFGWYYTVVFSPSLELGDLIDSVKDLYSVCIEALPGEHPRAYGPFRLVRYVLFLLREVFPYHDKLCAEEGQLMLRHIEGDPAAAGALANLKGRTAAYLERCWGR